VMGWIGIEYQIEYTIPEWTFTILSVDKLIQNLNEQIKQEEGESSFRKVNVINYVNKTRKPAVESGVPTLIMIGHTTGDVGEVGDAEKMLEIMRKNNRPAVLIDIFDFFPKRLTRDNFNALADENWERSLATPGFITSAAEHELTQYSYGKVMKLKKNYPNGVIMLMTWPWYQLAAIRMGFKQAYPLISTFYPHNLETEKGKYSDLLKSCDMISCLTPVAMISAHNNEVEKCKVILGQHKYPYAIDEMFDNMNHGRVERKKAYISKILKKMNKNAEIPPNPILIGSISRIVDFYRNSFILESLSHILDQRKDVFLMFKGDYYNKGGDQEFFKLCDRFKDKPWFLYDDERSPMPEIFEIYSYLDIQIYANAVGNASVEIAGVGTPLLLVNNQTNRSLFKGVAIFFEENSNDLNMKVERFLDISDAQKMRMRSEIRNYAQQRFSPDVFKEKLFLAIDAAKKYHDNNDPSGIRDMQRRVEKQFDDDLNMFDYRG
jgi:hypothetical protein